MGWNQLRNFKLLRGLPAAGTKGSGSKGFAAVPAIRSTLSLQVVTTTISGDYRLNFDAKVEANFASVIGGFSYTTSYGTGGSQTIDLLNAFGREDYHHGTFPR